MDTIIEGQGWSWPFDWFSINHLGQAADKNNTAYFQFDIGFHFSALDKLLFVNQKVQIHGYFFYFFMKTYIVGTH